MKSNPDKRHLLASFREKIKTEIRDFKIENCLYEKPLEVHLF